jgi:AcrR family transcriptional regulator
LSPTTRKPASSEERTFTEEARRKQIIASAIETIAEIGYANASLAAIAERANTSKSVISYHFSGGKHELIGEMINYVYVLGSEFMLPRLAGAATHRETLRRYIITNFEFIASHPKEVRALVEAFTNYRPDTSITTPITVDMGTKNMREDVAGLAREILEPGQRNGEFRGFDPIVMAMTIRSAIDVVPPLLVNDPAFDIKTHGEEVATMFDLATRAD